MDEPESGNLMQDRLSPPTTPPPSMGWALPARHGYHKWKFGPLWIQTQLEVETLLHSIDIRYSTSLLTAVKIVILLPSRCPESLERSRLLLT